MHDGDWRLCRVPDLQVLRSPVPICEHPARLNGARQTPLDRQPPLLPERRLCEGFLDIADRIVDLTGQVAGNIVMDSLGHAVRAGQFHHSRQRLIIDLDEPGGVLGPITVVRDDHDYGLADIVDAVNREWMLRLWMREGWIRAE